jgi:acyl carrier protein
LIKKGILMSDDVIGKLRDTMQQSSLEQVDWDSVTPESKIDTLGFDSLSILDLIYDIQQAFEVEFEAEEMIEVTTVGELADFLKKKMA